MDTSVPHRSLGQGVHLMCFIYDCTHSLAVHSTASETDEKNFPEEEAIGVETFIPFITPVPSGAVLTTAELAKTDVHVLH